MISGVKLEPVRMHEEGQRRVLLEVATQYEPHNVIREYVTNSLDETIPGQRLEIGVVMFPDWRRMIISDNAKGMSPQKLDSLRYSLGVSQKAGMVDKRGEKGLGILAFASVGERAYIISREAAAPTGEYGYLELAKRGQIDSGFKVINDSEVETNFRPGFDCGTTVVIDQIDPNIMSKVYSVAFVKNLLSELYTPALLKGVKMSVGRIERAGRGGVSKKPKLELVEPTEFQGDLLFDRGIEIKDDDGRPLILEAMLNFNQDGATDKVAVYSKDVRVYKSISELPEFARDRFWGCGKLSGYLNDQFSKLILGRDGIDRTRKQFSHWISAVDKVRNELKDTVDSRIKRAPKQRETEVFREAWNALADAYKHLDRIYPSSLFVKAAVHGEEKRVIGVPPIEEPPRERREASQSHEESSRKGLGLTGGTYREDNLGTTLKVSPKRSISIGFPSALEFPLAEAQLRSKLEDKLGQPMIYINVTHRDYMSRANTKSSKDELMKYIIDVCAKEISLAEANEAISQRVATSEDAVRNALLRAENIKYGAFSGLGLS